MAILDEKGIEKLSMRALGNQLGVEAMSLYNHVANKDELIDNLLDMVLDEIIIPSNTSNWREAMYERAISARHAFQRHPWAGNLIDSRLTASPSRLRYFEMMLGSLERAGFSLELAGRAFSLMDSYIYGFELQRRSMTSGGEEDQRKNAETFSINLATGYYPCLSRMVELSMETGYNEKADFEFGLNLILDGLERLLSEKKSDA